MGLTLTDNEKKVLELMKPLRNSVTHLPNFNHRSLTKIMSNLIKKGIVEREYKVVGDKAHFFGYYLLKK